jgi:hypothetical protein
MTRLLIDDERKKSKIGDGEQESNGCKLIEKKTRERKERERD